MQTSSVVGRSLAFLSFLVFAMGVSACTADAASSEEPPAPAAGKNESDDPRPDTDENPPLQDVPVVGENENPRWKTFADGRQAALVELGKPILGCVARNDTTHPAFHGCIDWHSAAHGTWALLALSRLTKDPSYEQATVPILQSNLLAQELTYLKARGTSFEVPYGYAWFLVLARERAKANKTDLAPLGQYVAGVLDTWLTGMSNATFSSSLLADDYQNVSWAILNLWQYAKDNGDTARANRMMDLARTRLLPRDADCPLDRDDDATGFFPACLHRARALATMLPPAEVKTWADAFVPKTLSLSPIVEPVQAHHAGLNFSRSWGLYALYKATGNDAYRDLFLDHMEPWLERSDIWAGSYQSYAHWVAQFGVYAIALTYE